MVVSLGVSLHVQQLRFRARESAWDRAILESVASKAHEMRCEATVLSFASSRFDLGSFIVEVRKIMSTSS